MVCLACEENTSDIVKHVLLHCSKLYAARDSWFENIVNILNVTDSVNLFNTEEDIFIETVLGGRSDLLYNTDENKWEQFITSCAINIRHIIDAFLN